MLRGENERLNKEHEDKMKWKLLAADTNELLQLRELVKEFRQKGVTEDTIDEFVSAGEDLKKALETIQTLKEDLRKANQALLEARDNSDELSSEKDMNKYYKDVVRSLTDEAAKNKKVTREEMVAPIKLTPGFMASKSLPDDEDIANESEWLDHIYDKIGSKSEHSDLKFSRRQIYAYHTAQKIRDMSPLVVLAGVSGTGKSELPKNYAIHGGMNFLSIPVKPDWDSPASLFGYYNSIERRFEATELVQALYHKLKDAAESVFGTELPENEIPYYIEQVKPLASTKVSERRYKNFLGEIAIANEQLFESLKKKVNPEDRDEDHGTRMILNPTEVGLLSRIAETIQEIEQMRRPIPNGMNELGKMLLKKLKVLCQPSKNSTWLEEDEKGILHLCGVPKNMGKVLYETVWSNQVGHVLTSGTLSDGETFNYFVQEIGLGNISRNRMKITKTESPFDYEEHTRLYIPKGMPFPATDSESYLQAIAKQVLSLVEATNGHTAILFTSYKVLSAVYERTKDLLGKYELFCMTRANKTAISDFKKSRNGILFASGSMWEGVDCVGDCLSSVIIPRLPFPIRSALLDQKKELSPDIQEFIQTYAVPEMLIKLRQGVGRLIRSETDTGLIAILDCRAENGPYAERVQSVMSKYPEVKTIDEIYDFFKTVKSEDYFAV